MEEAEEDMEIDNMPPLENISPLPVLAPAVEFRCLKVVNPMSYLTVGLLENTSRLVDVSLNWTINSTG